MSFWKKILTNKNKEAINITKKNSNNDPRNIESLFKIVKPIIKEATQINVQSPSDEPNNSYLLSHFGGRPYFDKDEVWPINKKGKPLSFIFQVYNDGVINLPKEIKLLQFFYDWDEFPWDTKDDGWLVKIYKEVDIHNCKIIECPDIIKKPKYCEIKFQEVLSLPDWEGLDTYNNDAFNMSCEINVDDPWEPYERVLSELVGEQDYRSQLDGYPKWVQGDNTFIDNNGKPLRLLFQLDSEKNANLMWGDAGLIYVYYDESDGYLGFLLQCH